MLFPNVKLENLDVTGEPRVINGNLDYGAVVAFDVTNITDKPQEVQLRIEVSCSEGKWTQDQKVALAGKESRRLTLFFPEPTIDSSDLKGRVHIVDG